MPFWPGHVRAANAFGYLYGLPLRGWLVGTLRHWRQVHMGSLWSPIWPGGTKWAFWCLPVPSHKVVTLWHPLHSRVGITCGAVRLVGSGGACPLWGVRNSAMHEGPIFGPGNSKRVIRFHTGQPEWERRAFSDAMLDIVGCGLNKRKYGWSPYFGISGGVGQSE